MARAARVTRSGNVKWRRAEGSTRGPRQAVAGDVAGDGSGLGERAVGRGEAGEGAYNRGMGHETSEPNATAERPVGRETPNRS